MSNNYNSTLQSNNTDLQGVLQTLQTKAAAGQATPEISVSSTGLITATAGTKSTTKQLTTQAAKTVTPSTSSQTAVASGVYTTGAVTVAAIPSTYIQPSATKGATTYTPSTSDQTIAAGTYCSGVQTIKGDANLVTENIKSGVSIFGVSGSYAGSGGSGDEDEPSGSNPYLPTISTGFVSSTAEGTIVYTCIQSDGISTYEGTLSYFAQTKKYRYPMDEALLANTPIIVLSSGNISMPTATGYSLRLIASGTGYSVFTYTVSDGADGPT